MDWTPLAVSLRAATLGMLIALAVGVPAARAVAGMKGPGKALIDGLCTLPMVLPPTVLGYVLLAIFGRNGAIGRALLAIGVRVVFSWQATVIAAAIVAFPLVYRTARAAFEQLDRAILDAARTLGLSERRIFTRVMLPMAKPGIAGGAILAFARALGEFGATLMLAGNIPGRTQTIPVAIWFAVEGGDERSALAWVIVISLISFAVISLMNAVGEGKR